MLKYESDLWFVRECERAFVLVPAHVRAYMTVPWFEYIVVAARSNTQDIILELLVPDSPVVKSCVDKMPILNYQETLRIHCLPGSTGRIVRMRYFGQKAKSINIYEFKVYGIYGKS